MSRLFIGHGGVAREADASCFAEAMPGADFVWLHLDTRSDDVDGVLSRLGTIPAAAAAALRASETRPRCAQFASGALINLRGLGAAPPVDGDPLVSIRIWVQDGLAVSLSLRDLGAFDAIVARVLSGEVTDPGNLVAAMAKEISDALDPRVADLGDELDAVESRILDTGHRGERHLVSALRATAISYRRFLAPQRQALERLMTMPADWLAPEDRVHLQEAADRCARMVEELEAVRERAALAHEALTDLRAEHMNRQALLLAIVALIFLPLTFVTGLLGMNVVGIPFAHESWAFWGVVAFCLAVGGAVGIWFKATGWLGK